MLEQVKALGINFKEEEAAEVQLHHYPFKIIVKNEQENFFFSKTIILATGTRERKLFVPGEKKYFNRGVSTCAICDGAFYSGTNLPIIVVGGGYTAFETTLFVERYTSNNIFLIHRRSEFRAGKSLVEKVKADKKVKILTNTVVLEIKGDGEKATAVEVQNLLTNKKKTIPLAVLFLNIGADPETCLVKNQEIETNQEHYFVAKQEQKTSVKGVFVAGDAVKKKLRQIVTAVSDGAVAAQEAINFLNEQNKKEE
jgi:thioredoxin reductase (NADPH)